MTGNESKLFLIGDWLVSPDEDTISRDGQTRRLEPLAMGFLVYLASRPGEVVSRADLEEHVWRGGLVGYDAVTNTVTKLRKALGDNARDPLFIATVPKRGYQLIAAVRQPEPDQVRDETPPASPSVSAHNGSRATLLMLAAAVSSVLLVLVAWLLPGEHIQPQATIPANKPTLIVLPFDNLSEDAAQDEFTNGMTEDLITDLSGIAGIRVLASNTAFSYQGQNRTPQEIREEVGVDYVLTGSVRRRGDSLRINAHLVNTDNAYQVWAHRFDRKTAQIFAVQDELTAQIVKALAIQLSPQEQKRLAGQPTDNLLAYDHFQEGQRLSKINTLETNHEAQDAYRRAIEADPQYGRAYGALAYTIAYAFRRGWTDNLMQDIDRAYELAERGVRLNPNIPQTYWSLAYVHMMRKEFNQAKAVVQDALRIAPNFADGYGLLALIQNGLGEAREAIANIETGIKLNPFYTWDYPYNLGRANYILGNYEKAIEHLEAARTRNPNVSSVRLILAASYLRAGRVDDAEWEVEEIQGINPNETLSHLAKTLASNHEESRQRLLTDLREAGLPE